MSWHLPCKPDWPWIHGDPSFLPLKFWDFLILIFFLHPIESKFYTWGLLLEYTCPTRDHTLKENRFSFLRSWLKSLFPQLGMGALEFSLLHAGMLTGLILYKQAWLLLVWGQRPRGPVLLRKHCFALATPNLWVLWSFWPIFPSGPTDLAKEARCRHIICGWACHIH